MANHTDAAPSLPPASIDFNKLHDQCRAGRKPDTALDNALVKETLAEPPAAPPAAPAADESSATDAPDRA